MENPRGWIKRGNQEQQIDLLPGFRFYPSDEELITCYLLPKTLDFEFIALAIGEADLRKLEPWELPWIAKMGEEEWYFFCLREKRYPTGQRTNRGTKSGYWKATGKDKEIYSGKFLVGMKKTLVFYQGRAPKGVKSNWVIHEYRLDGKYSKDNLPQSAQSECVISRVFHKNPSGKKTHISALPAPNPQPEYANSLPPLIPCSPCNSGFDTKPSLPSSSRTDVRRNLNNQPPYFTPENPPPSSFPSPYFPDCLQFSDSSINYDTSFLLDDNGDGNDLLASLKAEPSNDTGPAGGGGDGGGGGYFAGDLSDDEPIDINSILDY